MLEQVNVVKIASILRTDLVDSSTTLRPVWQAVW